MGTHRSWTAPIIRLLSRKPEKRLVRNAIFTAVNDKKTCLCYEVNCGAEQKQVAGIISHDLWYFSAVATKWV